MINFTFRKVEEQDRWTRRPMGLSYWTAQRGALNPVLGDSLSVSVAKDRKWGMQQTRRKKLLRPGIDRDEV